MDAFVTFSNGRPWGLIPFCRSVRTTGCAARIVVLLRPGVASPAESKVLKLCGGNLVEVDAMGDEEVILKICVYYDFLYMHRREFERVLFVEMSDVMLQGDPFTSDIHTDGLYLVKVRQQKGQVELSELIFGGGVEASLVFLDISLSYYLHIFEGVSDVVNLAEIYRLIVSRSKRVRSTILGPQNGFVDLAYEDISRGDERPGSVATGDGVRASVVGRFSHNRLFAYNYYDRCPRGRLKLTTYMRSIPEGYMNGTIDRHGNAIEGDDMEDE
jgi:hypothetical protein